MSMLTGPEIHEQIMKGNIVIEPFDAKNLGANSYDLRLGNRLLTYDLKPCGPATVWMEGRGLVPTLGPVLGSTLMSALDAAIDNPTREHTIPKDVGVVLMPGVLYLAHTEEYTETHGFVPTIEGRSSIARLGISTHASAGFGDDGFKGTWTMEISVVHPVRIYVGMRICQIAYSTLQGTRKPYAGKYNGQRAPVASGVWKDFVKEPGMGTTKPR